ncbi:MAG: hypothetical protein DLM54_04390 [Acidimicrobiales bacterium]|nr:MAG: hypothetical protein DLM54_04390 [Acidimicrobiales bacterium]
MMPLSLAELGRPTSLAGQRILRVMGALGNLFPDGGLRRGSTVTVAGTGLGTGATSLLLALLAGPSAEGSWCAAVGLPRLGLVAAAELDIRLSRLVLVPTPGPSWPTVTAALLDACDLVAVQPPTRVRLMDARRLAARARERGAVLVVAPGGGIWPEVPDVRLSALGGQWHGLGVGHGHVQGRWLEVEAAGRRGADRMVRAALWLPAGKLPAPEPPLGPGGRLGDAAWPVATGEATG